MGRRKERRLAAISAAGRRVKLDLFAEPSGDLGGSSAQEEVGGNGDSRTHAELPSSPSSSGKQPQNPLLLLEQYSDEESDDGSTEGRYHTVSDDASIDTETEAKIAAGKETEDTENNDGERHAIRNAEQLPMHNASPSMDSYQKNAEVSISNNYSDDLQRPTNKMEEAIYNTSVPHNHFIGDVSSGWRMVLHEDSNQYYYWNILTGETSWEVPDALIQDTVGSVEKADGDTKAEMNAVAETYKLNTSVDMKEDSITSRIVNAESKVSSLNYESADLGTMMEASHEGYKGDSTEDEEGHRNANQSNGNSLLGRFSLENRRGTELPSELIKQCGSLLERLNTAKGLNCCTEDQDLKLKYALEIEIRLGDIKALASHGSSLLAFWLHSDSQLKRVEAAIDGAIKHHHSASPTGYEAVLEPHEGIGNDAEIDSSEKKAFAATEFHSEHIAKLSNFKAHNDGAAPTGHVPLSSYSSTCLADDVGGKSEITETEKESELNTPGPTVHSGEDVDMDVDMEVEDTPAVKSPNGGPSGAYSELSNLHNTLTEQESTVSGKIFSVPPPVEDWIPPPPPDDEPFPPPPPDDEPFPPPPPGEPPGTSNPPSSHLGSVLPFPYSEQYTLAYPGSSLEYYGQTNLEASASTLYTLPEGGQVAVSHVPHYYEAVSNVYGVTPLVVNPVESAAYYDLQNESLNPVPLISVAAEAPVIQSEPVPKTLDSGLGRPSDSLVEGGSNLLAKTSLNVVESGHGTAKAPPEAGNAQPSIGVPASSVANSGSVPSSDTAAAAAAAAASKAQSKVSRRKKRTVAVVSTLRSNKKVSGLVDKWKAAKEELQEEEEPEDACEILEKKRRREIEEWRAHQIATGEAKDNANFQPLGGDWRERVKRKRAERMKETEQSSSDVAPDGNKQPDLVELSKGLPSGWQVYWDESSKQVYYGNILTSETTWDRPAG